MPNRTGNLKLWSHYQVASQHVQGSVFTVHFTICTKTKTNFEPSPNPGLVSDPVIFFWSIWKHTKHDEGFLVRRFGPDFRKVFQDDRFSSHW